MVPTVETLIVKVDTLPIFKDFISNKSDNDLTAILGLMINNNFKQIHISIVEKEIRKRKLTKLES